MFPTRPELNWSLKSGLNGKNFIVRIDHQINANNTYTVRYLTERQPNRDLLTGDTATLTSGNYELDIDQTASVAYNRVFGSKALNTLRVSMESEDIHRGAEPGTFLETNDKTLEAPVLNHLSFNEQGHVNGQHRIERALGLDDTFSWFVPGQHGDHDLKFGFQYLYSENELYEQGSMNGVFTFPSDHAFNAADPSTYPERLTIRVPMPSGSRPSSSYCVLRAGQVEGHQALTLNLGLRYDVDIFQFTQPFNPLLTAGDYPVDKNNFQPRAGFAYNLIDGRSFAAVSGATTRSSSSVRPRRSRPMVCSAIRSSSISPSLRPIRARATGGFRPIRCSSTVRS